MKRQELCFSEPGQAAGVAADLEVAEGQAQASATSWGSGRRSSRSSVMMACWIWGLGARPLPVRVFLTRAAA